MSDLISRQAAIDAIKAYLTFADWKPSVEEILEMAVNDITNMLERLPSAQSEQSIAEWQKDFRGYINMLDIPRDDYRGIMEYINEVPSAQPEIIRCRDCKYGELDDDDRWYCRSLGCQIGNEDGSGFCADAERRE